jgi:hypothetical protein
MPRLVGKQSNTAAPLSLLILVAIGVVMTLEYIGFTEVLNGSGTWFQPVWHSLDRQIWRSLDTCKH